MSGSIEQLKSIIESSNPEDLTHHYTLCNGDSLFAKFDVNYRSLDDLHTIVAQAERIEALEKAHTETCNKHQALEKECIYLFKILTEVGCSGSFINQELGGHGNETSSMKIENALAIRDLEQQAKGVRDLENQSSSKLPVVLPCGSVANTRVIYAFEAECVVTDLLVQATVLRCPQNDN